VGLAQRDFQVHGLVLGRRGHQLVDYPGSSSTIIEGINEAAVLVGGYGSGLEFLAFVAYPVDEAGHAGR
jgi:hypothetical protein